jgi:hypothetical protein
VVSAKASLNGRPFLWKNRDYSSNWKQEVLFSKRTGVLKIVDNTVFPMKGFASGGVNKFGFSIVNSTCYQKSPIHEYISNANLDLLEYALNHCSKITDFEDVIENWHDDKKNRLAIISGNFAVIDSKGGSVLYELYSGTGYHSYGAKLMINRIDANTGFVKNESGLLIGNNGEIGYVTVFPEKNKFRITDDQRNITNPEFHLARNGTAIMDSKGRMIDDGKQFSGFVNRANSNFWVRLKSDVERESRATNLLNHLAGQGDLSYRTVLQYVARDIDPSSDDPDESVDTSNSISRYCTRFAMVVDGVPKNENPSLTTMWVNLGEPSCGIATPYFNFAQKVPYHAWADTIHKYYGPIDTGPSSLLNKMINASELRVYSNNISDGEAPSPPEELNSYYMTSVLKINMNQDYEEIWNDFEGLLSGWFKGYTDFLKKYDTMDRTINYDELLKIQTHTLPLEDTIIDNTERFLKKYRNRGDKSDRVNFYKFSHYCADYAYKNFNGVNLSPFNWKFNE